VCHLNKLSNVKNFKIKQTIADAVSGGTKMFLASGFNDFLSNNQTNFKSRLSAKFPL
jgi:hypothetical protein